ncbi:MAG: bacteriohemerythrin [Candidatus Scalindua sp.]|jgi:hemerythrin|nr:bacteriohemerythrin [Candidatus Scalindua sp.]MDV5165671.1 bacteriohemerythrin [Candidatus Scalindua sp.]
MIEWDKKYCVGISRIDNDHKRYIDTLNKLIHLKKNNETPDGIKQVLREMTNYVLTHFKTEETYMLEFEYPEYQDHKNEHHDFAMKIISYLDKVVNGEYEIAYEILEDLKSWLVNHIQSTDLKYIDCFIKNGLK